jgi:hypothetical protein
MQTTAGSYTDSLLASGGCDSLVVTALTVNPVYAVMDTVQICVGDSAFLGGAYQDTIGSYVDMLTSAAGCDSVVTTYLNIVTAITSSATAWICDGDSILLGGSMQTTAGTYVDSLVAAAGCDSVVTTVLGVWQSYSMMDTVTICDGDSVMLGGAMQTTSGTYTDSMTTMNGCDSILTTMLVVNPTYSMMLSDSICDGDSLFVGGAFQTTSGTYTDSMVTANGCDSIVMTTLTVIALPVIDLGNDTSLCPGASLMLDAGSGFTSYLWSPGGETTQTITVDTIGTYSVVAISGGLCSANGSITVSAGTTPNVSATAAPATICEGDSATLTGSGAGGAGTYMWSPATGLSSTTGAVVSAAPTTTTNYVVTGTNGAGCSAMDTVTVTVNPAPSLTATQSSGGAPVCINEEDTITVTSSATDFIWNLPGGTLQTTNTTHVVAVEQTTDIVITALGVGGCNSSITVTVTVDTNCTDTTFVRELGTGIEISAYMQHSTSDMVVTLGTGEPGAYRLLVVDALGHLIHTETMLKPELSQQRRINLSGKATGVYFLRVESEKGVYHQKLFKH